MTDDLISRQAAIDALDGKIEITGRTNAEAVKGYVRLVKDRLERLPSAQPEPQWIPCSERLPEDDTDVLISYRYKDGEGDTSHVYIDTTSYGDMYFGGNAVHDLYGNKIKHWRPPFAYFESNYYVIAWMPLPEPYKEGEHETDRR